MNCLNPKFSKTFIIDYYFEMVQKLRFEVYDIDSDACSVQDADFLGELECTLGQVGHLSGSRRGKILDGMIHLNQSQNHFVRIQIVSSRQLTKPLVMKDKRPAGKGTITVSLIIQDLNTLLYLQIKLRNE